MNIYDFDKPVIAIVAIKSQASAKELNPCSHLPYYQVCVDPNRSQGNTNGLSIGGGFIRFGYAVGDELNGWQPVHDIEIFEVLADNVDYREIYPALTNEQVAALENIASTEIIDLNQNPQKARLME